MDFTLAQTWENYNRDGSVNLRLDMIQKLIPSDVGTILDAGCGNGIIANALAKEYQVTGIDVSEAALEGVQCSKQLASVTAIPFPDASFDLVICSQVLEHLDDEALEQACQELKRVSRRYLLISVPHEEPLLQKQYKCADCGHTAHIHGHLQYFTLNRLHALFTPEFFVFKQRVFGMRNSSLPPQLLSWKHRLGQWALPSEGQRCENCGSDKFLHQSSLATKLVNGFGLLLSRRRPYWLLGIYRKRNSDNA